MSNATHRKLFIFGLAALVIMSRLLPHPANFTATGAVALVAGAYLSRRWAVALTIIAMLVSDAILGFYDWPVMIAVYGSLIAAIVIGQRVRKNVWWGSVAGGSLSGSVLFFLATNWAVWQFTSMYPHTAAGLATSYLAALPFFRNSLLSDLVWSGALFSAAEFVRRGYWRRSIVSTAPLRHQTFKP